MTSLPNERDVANQAKQYVSCTKSKVGNAMQALRQALQGGYTRPHRVAGANDQRTQCGATETNPRYDEQHSTDNMAVRSCGRGYIGR